MLRKVPLVTVDGEDNIQVNGSSNFKVHVNADTFRAWSKNSYPSRRYGISISWRFGELKTQVKKTQRSITNDDVKAGGDNKSGGSMQ